MASAAESDAECVAESGAPAAESAATSAVESVAESVAEYAAESVAASAVESVTEFVAESAAEFVAESGAPAAESALPAIGVAPFAAHDGKIYPLELMREVVRRLAEGGRCDIYLFGGGQKEREVLEEWETEMPRVRSVAGRLGGLDKELELMSTLRLMLSMDSANMHLASLVGTPVISIWGATHPLAGFMGWRQSEANAIQVDLPCRPCSIFGNKPCLRGDYACLRQITPEQIVAKVNDALAH
ncbi:MAG: glycosyltransferase family 9 protein [Bacteroidaceae bacterium]|nr:glycosyltransferase family 9 protein [Bacteroidaceae bacterium]